MTLKNYSKEQLLKNKKTTQKSKMTYFGCLKTVRNLTMETFELKLRNLLEEEFKHSFNRTITHHSKRK